MFVVKLHLPGLGTVLKNWFETKEAPKHFTPSVTSEGVSKQSLIALVTVCSRSA